LEWIRVPSTWISNTPPPLGINSTSAEVISLSMRAARLVARGL
jgi:hypothetical protein